MPTNYKLAIKHLDHQTPFRVDGDPEVFENITFTSGKTYTQAELDSASVTLATQPPLSELMYAESDSVSNTTSQTWVRKTTLEFRAHDGDYLVEWSAEARASKDKTKAAFQCELDDSIKINSGNARLDGTGFHPFNGFKKLTLTAGVHTVDIDYMCGQSKRTVYIQNARIKITQL